MKLIEASKIENIKSKPVLHKQIGRLLKDKMPQKMIKFCSDHGGMGLAAPQIGLFQNFFIARLQGRWRVCFNPKIISISGETIELNEGCLSYPDLTVQTQRGSIINVQYYNASKYINCMLTSFDAVVFQHEFDHLQGVTIKMLMDTEKASEATGPRLAI